MSAYETAIAKLRATAAGGVNTLNRAEALETLRACGEDPRPDELASGRSVGVLDVLRQPDRKFDPEAFSPGRANPKKGK